MSNAPKRLGTFEFFTLDFSLHVLRFQETLIDLPPLTVDILEYLIDNRDRWISSDELMKKCWRATVSVDSVHKQISEIRRALGDAPKDPRFIETKPKRGWRFIANVTETIEAEPAEPEVLVIPSWAGTGTLSTDELSHLPAISPLPTAHSTARNRYPRTSWLLSLAGVAAAAVAIWSLPDADAKVIQSTQLTWDAKPKFGPLLTDGQRIFFREKIGTSAPLVSIPVSGGDAVPLDPSLSKVKLCSISADGLTLLLLSDDTEGGMWAYSIPSRKLRLIRTGANVAALSPDGSRVATTSGRDLSVFTLDGSLQSKVNLSGHPEYIQWSPAGNTIRFPLIPFYGSEASSVWDYSVQDRTTRRLAQIPSVQAKIGDGAWSHRGRYFFYVARGNLLDELWVTREASWLSGFPSSSPHRLTNGEPGSWDSPVASHDDEGLLFAINHYVRPELVRLDPASRSWQPAWDAAPMFELAYSSDCRWVAYTKFPDHSIWKARHGRRGATAASGFA